MTFVLAFLLAHGVWAKVPTEVLRKDMEKYVVAMESVEGWTKFQEKYPQHFDKVSSKQHGPQVGVEKYKIKVGDDEYEIGVGINSVYINAPASKVVSLLSNPKNFRALYDLDKSAELGAVDKDGQFEARIFKLVPGIETQDYVLKYTSHWEGKTWIQKASLVKDEKNFALRENIKIVEPSGEGSIYREVSLFYPHRWWVRLFDGVVKKVTFKELDKIGKSLKCAGEKVKTGEAMTEDIAIECRKANEG